MCVVHECVCEDVCSEYVCSECLHVVSVIMTLFKTIIVNVNDKLQH